MQSPSPCPTSSLLPRLTTARGSLSNFLAESWILFASLGMNLLPASLESSVALDGGPGVSGGVGAGDVVFLFFSPLGGGRYSFIDLKACWWSTCTGCCGRISDGDGRWIRAGLGVRHQRQEIWRKWIDACNLTWNVFFNPRMYCASFVIQSLFRKKKPHLRARHGFCRGATVTATGRQTSTILSSPINKK
jgi:hypothetical protein